MPATARQRHPQAMFLGGGIVEVVRKLRARVDNEYGGTIPPHGVEVTAEAGGNPEKKRFAMHAFGAQFAEVHVNVDSGEVRVPRLLGIFAAGRIINAKTARSQLLGGMTIGLSMAPHEQSYLDKRYGHFANRDFAEYHIATSADVGAVEVDWLDEDDPHVIRWAPRASGNSASSGRPRRSPMPHTTRPACACATYR